MKTNNLKKALSYFGPSENDRLNRFKACAYMLLITISLGMGIRAVAQPNGNFNTLRLKSGNDTATFSPQPNGTLLYGNGGSLYFKTANEWITLSGGSAASAITDPYPVGQSKFGVDQVVDPDFVVFGSAGVQTGYHGGGTPTPGTAIEWQFVQDTPAAGVPTVFFDSVAVVGTGVRFYFPPVKLLLNATWQDDEVSSPYGAKVGLQWFLDGAIDMFWWSPKPLNLIFTGNGSGSWTLSGNSAYFNTLLHNGYASFEINGALSSTSYAGCSMNYYGPNNYHIKYYNGISPDYAGGFTLVDLSGNTVTNPTTSDIVVINGFPIQVTSAFNLATWDVYNLGLKSLSSTHINVQAEAWIINQRTSETNVYLRWQEYPAATGYKIYRSTSSYFATQTLVYSGTGTSYTDTVVSGVYYYKMVATVAGVDTYISKTISKY